MDPRGLGGVSTPQLEFKFKLGALGVENKPKNEVKIQNFPNRMSIKPKMLRLRRETLVKQDKLIFIMYIAKLGQNRCIWNDLKA